MDALPAKVSQEVCLWYVDKGTKVRTTSDDTGGKSEREKEVSVHGWGSIADQDSGSTADSVCYRGGKGLETERGCDTWCLLLGCLLLYNVTDAMSTRGEYQKNTA